MRTQKLQFCPDGETELFDILTDVLQGDILTPYLFAIGLDYATCKAINNLEEQFGFKLLLRRGKGKTAAECVTDLDFADNIALICEITQAQKLSTRVKKEAAKIGLRLNTTKTEVLPYGQQTEHVIKAWDESHIKVVKDFKYLGLYVDNTEKEVKV